MHHAMGPEQGLLCQQHHLQPQPQLIMSSVLSSSLAMEVLKDTVTVVKDGKPGHRLANTADLPHLS